MIDPVIRTSRLTRYFGDVPVSADRFEPLPDDWERADVASFNQHHAPHWYDRFGYLGQIMVDDAMHGYFSLVAHKDQVMVYVQQRGVTHVITPDGVFNPEDNPTGRFRRVKMLSNTTIAANVYLRLERNRLLIADDGVFQVDFEARKVNQLIDAEVVSAAIELPQTKGDAASLWAIASDRLSRYRITSSVAGEPLDSAGDPIITKTQRYPIPMLAAEKTNEFALDPIDMPSFATVAPINDTKIVVTNRINAFRYHVQVLGTDSGPKTSGIVRIKANSQASAVGPELYFIPPGAIGLGSAITYFSRDDVDWEDMNDTNPISRLFIVVVLHAVIGAAFAIWISGRRGVSRKTRGLWAVLGAIFGVVALPAIVAIHAKLIYQPCPRCDKPRRIDTMVCGHCGADWDRFPLDGNEVIGGRSADQLTPMEHSA